jgi:hypothetical protein
MVQELEAKGIKVERIRMHGSGLGDEDVLPWGTSVRLRQEKAPATMLAPLPLRLRRWRASSAKRQDSNGH